MPHATPSSSLASGGGRDAGSTPDTPTPHGRGGAGRGAGVARSVLDAPPHPLVADLVAGRIDEPAFLAALAEQGTPLIVDDPADADHMLVTHVHVAVPGDEPHAVEVADVATRHHAPPAPLEDIPGTRVWHATVRMRADVRASYWFEVHDASGDGVVDDPHARAGRLADARVGGAVLEGPAAEPLPDLPAAGTAPRGTMYELVVPSAQLGDERRVWVSTPEGWSAETGPWPFVVVFDGIDGHTAPLVRDRLVASGAVRPFVIVLVDQMGRREHDLPGNPAYERMLATELVPHLRERFALSADPADAVVSGSSFGGICAGLTALHHPAVFGGALMQSPSCWHHVGIVEAWRASGGAEPTTPARTPALIAEFAAAPAAPIRIWQECGAYEEGPPPARIAQSLGNRWLHDVLRAKGYDAVYREFAGGHDAAWWRGTWADGVRHLLGR